MSTPLGDRRSSAGRVASAMAILAILALVAAACSSSGGHSATASPSAGPKAGGVLRVGLSQFGFSGNLDPTDEYTQTGWDVLDTINRTLVVYRYASGSAGLQIVPDLATSVPKPTDDGLTYTFHLKQGIRFGPPVNREITSKDVEYAFERINSKPVAAQYGFYYDGVIKGMTGLAPKPEPISGISTPNPTTIVFHLTQPTGDFLERLAMPDTAPIPPEVGRCFPQSGSYGRDVIASGAYMIEGEPQLNVSSCETIKPLSGYNPATGITMVRNPNYSPATDTETGRENYPNAIQITIDTNVADIFEKIQTGAFDISFYDQPPKTVLQKYLSTPSLKPLLKSDVGGFVDFVSMNTETPPFDDVHVRQAVNWILDRAAIQQTWGGSIAGQIATEFIPPYILGGAAGANPYPTPGNAGSLAKAQAAMRLSSRYDPRHDGRCDVAACKNVVLVDYNIPPWTDVEPIVVQDLAKIGIQVTPREMESGAAFNAHQNPKNRIPLYMGDWIWDYPDPYTYMFPLFDGHSITAEGNEDFTLVGLTPAIAKSIGVPYPPGGSPNVDSRIAACEVMVVGPSRDQCWANLDTYLMRSVSPTAPFMWQKNLTIVGKDVTAYQFTFEIGIVLQNIAVSNHLSA